jgi:hypothetical protein
MRRRSGVISGVEVGGGRGVGDNAAAAEVKEAVLTVEKKELPE